MTTGYVRHTLITLVTLLVLACPAYVAVAAPLGGGNNTTNNGQGAGNTDTTGLGGGNTDTGGLGGGNTDTGGTLVNPLRVKSLEDLLNLILDAVISIGRIVLIVMLVWTGFLFVTAQGKEEKIRTARAALFWTIIGGLILLGAKGLSLVIESTATNLTS